MGFLEALTLIAMGFLEALTFVFVAFKLGGVIAWSWWLVLAPLYPAAAIYLFFFAMIALHFIGSRPSRKS